MYRIQFSKHIQNIVPRICNARLYSTGPIPLKTRHLLSTADLSVPELKSILSRSAELKHSIKTRNLLPGVTEFTPGPLAGQSVAMMFSKRSTRTRVSTETAIVLLGGHPMFLGKDDIQLGVNESLYDTARVLSSMVSMIVARVDDHSIVETLAKESSVPVVNALSSIYHPLQALADLLTIQESYPQGIKGLKVAWVGDATNVLYDLAIAGVKMGINIAAATPDKYPFDKSVLDVVKENAQDGATISLTKDPLEAIKNANIIVTDTWISMGQEAEKAQRLKDFAGYQVTIEMANKGGAKKDWKFMHCLPRKPEEVSDEVFYSNRSLVFPEAENRKWTVLAILESLANK